MCRGRLAAFVNRIWLTINILSAKGPLFVDRGSLVGIFSDFEGYYWWVRQLVRRKNDPENVTGRPTSTFILFSNWPQKLVPRIFVIFRRLLQNQCLKKKVFLSVEMEHNGSNLAHWPPPGFVFYQWQWPTVEKDIYWYITRIEWYITRFDGYMTRFDGYMTTFYSGGR